MALTKFRRTASSPSGYNTTANTGLIPQKWSKEDYKFAFTANPLMPFMGMGDTSIIQVNKDFLKDKGDKITFALRALSNDDGQGDDGVYEGNEASMTFYDDSVIIHERGHSWAINGNMSEQSAYDDLRNKNRSVAREWVGRIQAADMIAALSGLPTMKLAGKVTGERAVDASSEYIETVNQVAITDKSETATRHFCGGQTAAGVLERVSGDAAIDSSTDNLFGTQVIEYVKRMAAKDITSTGTFLSPIRPVMIGGEPFYLLFINRLQEKALRGETAWVNAVQNAGVRGNENPLFKAVDYIWNNVLVKVTELIHQRTGAGGYTEDEYFDSTSDAVPSGITVARALFCGAQAATLAWGKMPVWKDGFKDWQQTKFGTHTNMIYGVKKTVFNSIPFGCITVDTAVKAD